jgi:hypothetical protein
MDPYAIDSKTKHVDPMNSDPDPQHFFHILPDVLCTMLRIRNLVLFLTPVQFFFTFFA